LKNAFENGRPRIAGVGGTPREGSTSLGAVRRALAAAGEAGAASELLDALGWLGAETAGRLPASVATGTAA